MYQDINEKKKVLCKQCKETKLWIYDGKYPNGIKKWRDESGLTCNGRLCGLCNQKRVKGTMRITRAHKKAQKA